MTRPARTFSPVLGALWALLSAAPAREAVAGGNCAATPMAATALPDLGTGTYQGQTGGLYPGGSNAMPQAHHDGGLREIARVQPRNAAGSLDCANGRIGLVSLGMSNTTREFSVFKPVATADPARNTAVVVVDGAQGGQDAPVWANPGSNAWCVLAGRVAQAGLSPQQVQVAWMKHAVAGPAGGFPAAANQLRGYLQAIAQNLRANFPNCRVAYLSSRIYAGYATTTLNPEPYSYESGFSVKWVIADQIGGAPALNYDPAQGPVMAPWLAWGPYLWANGTVARSDGLVWNCCDLENDGTHPCCNAATVNGRMKVALMLHQFFKADDTARRWYVAGGQPCALTPQATQTPCACTPTPAPTNPALGIPCTLVASVGMQPGGCVPGSPTGTSTLAPTLPPTPAPSHTGTAVPSATSSPTAQPIVVFPNPARRDRDVRFAGLPGGAEVAVFDVAGARLAVLTARTGEFAVAWKPGRAAASGPYVYAVRLRGTLLLHGTFALLP